MFLRVIAATVGARSPIHNQTQVGRDTNQPKNSRVPRKIANSTIYHSTETRKRDSKCCSSTAVIPMFARLPPPNSPPLTSRGCTIVGAFWFLCCPISSAFSPFSVSGCGAFYTRFICKRNVCKTRHARLRRLLLAAASLRAAWRAAFSAPHQLLHCCTTALLH